MKTKKGLKIELLYEENTNYSNRFQEIVKHLEKVSVKWNVPYHLILASSLSQKQIEEIKTRIREVPPQVRGRVVSSDKFPLPLSASKQLNLKKTPIALLYDSEQIIDVYPHALGTAIFTIEDFLNQMIMLGPTGYANIRGLMEDPLIRLIRDDPSILEEGSVYLESKLLVDRGEIDILLRDKSGKYIVIEVETNASDSAVGQVCRLAFSYMKTKSLKEGEVRKAVVFRGCESGFIEAARGASVEAYQITLKKEA